MIPGDSRLRQGRQEALVIRTVLVYGFCVLWMLGFACLPYSWETRGESSFLGRITIIHPLLITTISWATLAMVAGLFIASCISIWRPWLRWPFLGIVITLLLFPICGIMQVGRNLGPWTMHGQVTTADGQRYVFLDSSFLQGQLMAIGRYEQEGWFSQSFEVLVDNNGDSPRSWASVIRPRGAQESYGQLYLHEGTFLLGVRLGNRAFLAYDLKERVAYGHGEIEALSPFILLTADNGLHEEDIASTCNTIGSWAEICMEDDDIRSAESFVAGEAYPGVPTMEMMRAGLHSPLPGVRQAAEKLLACINEAQAEVAAHVAKVKEAAGPGAK